MILLAILLPPVAVLMCGKPFQALLNCVLTLFFYFPGMIHAVLVVNSHNADKRHKEQLAAMYAQREAMGNPIVVSSTLPPVPFDPITQKATEIVEAATLRPGPIQ